MTTTAHNKQVMQHIFDELARGNGAPFLESLADDCSWTMTGTTAWSKTYRGKAAILGELLRPLMAKFADQYTNTAHRLIAEDDFVVVECRGRVTTKTGVPYHNTYCWVCRLADGKIRELTEYMDTALVASALGEPAAS